MNFELPRLSISDVEACTRQANEHANRLQQNGKNTRKPSWRKGKRATAVRVWRPLAKKSTANQRYAISYWWIILTVGALLTVYEIFSGVEVENRHFRPLYCDCSPLAEERPAKIINVIYASLKSTFSRLQFCCWLTGLSSFVLPLLPLIKSAKSREIPRKFELIAVFLLVTSSNYPSSGQSSARAVGARCSAPEAPRLVTPAVNRRRFVIVR